MSRRTSANSPQGVRRRSAGRLAVCLGLTLGSLLAPCGAVRAAVDRTAADTGRESIVVGLIVDDVEVGQVEVVREESGFLLPLAPLESALGISARTVDQSTTLSTPLGELTLPAGATETISGQIYLRSLFLESDMRISIRFDQRLYALVLEPVWSAPEEEDSPSRSRDAASIEPDVHAPGTALTGLGGVLTHSRYGDSTVLSGAVHLDGRFRQGLWQVWLEDSSNAPFVAREYYWHTRRGQQHYVVGKQRAQLHPSMTGFDLAGLQVGWSNGSIQPGVGGSFGNILSPRSVRTEETLRGNAPPGSFVQLRLDGVVIDTRQVGFGGTYEFYKVQLPSRQATLVELLIFDPRNLRIPIEIRRQRLATSDLLLPRAVSMHIAGIGAAGRFTKGWIGNRADQATDLGGFYQWRQGLSARVTGETSIQYDGQRAQSFVGLVARPHDSWVASGGLIQTPGALGYTVELEGYYERWQLFGRSEIVPSELGRSATSYTRSDHKLELVHRPLAKLTVGLVLRDLDDGLQEATYARPWITWRPTPALYFDARPDAFGDYLLNASWRMTEATRLRLFASRNNTVELTHDLNSVYRIGANTDFGQYIETRHTLFANRLGRGARPWNVKAGLIHEGGRWGGLLGGNVPILPGLFVRAEYQSIPYQPTTGEPEGRLWLSIVTDLSHASGRFVPGRQQMQRNELGGIAGRIVVDGESKRSGDGLAGVKILIDGRARTNTDSGGRFFIAGLEQGFYEVQLDPENLPIHMNPARTRFVAEVAPGAATRVDFVVRFEYGIAGRVIGTEGNPLAEVSVELVDASGAIVGRTRTDQFGLYRLDRVAPGSYVIQIVRRTSQAKVEILARRPVIVSDDFLFDQNIRIENRPQPETKSAAHREPLDSPGSGPDLTGG